MKMAIKASKVALMGATDENAEIPPAEEHGASEVFFQHGAQYEAQHERCGVEFQAHEQIADEAKNGGDENIIQVAVDAECSDAAEKKGSLGESVGSF